MAIVQRQHYKEVAVDRASLQYFHLMFVSRGYLGLIVLAIPGCAKAIT